jgi:hypothetical protein
MRIFKFIIIIILAAVAFASCVKIQQLPPVPKIEFTSFEVFDTTDILGNDCKGGRLNFYFEDGDGDLGLHPAESAEESDTTNLFLTLFRKTGGIMAQVPDNDLMKPSAYRIPYMERTGQNKILKGTISVTFLYLFYVPADNDTIRYDFYIKDRAGNISNTAATSEIALSVNDLYSK